MKKYVHEFYLNDVIVNKLPENPRHENLFS